MGCRGVSAWSPKRSLREAVQVRPELPWSLWMLEASDPCAICWGELHTRNGTKYVAVNKSKPSDTKLGVIGLVICPAGFQSSFGPVFSYYSWNRTLWNSNVYYILCHCMLEMYNLLFCSFKRLQLWDCLWGSAETLTWLLNYVKSKKKDYEEFWGWANCICNVIWPRAYDD